VVLVVLAGRPVLLTRARQQVNALLYAWHPGTEGAGAITEVLFGRAAPGGRLPVSFPRVTGQVPVHYNHKSTGRWQRYVDAPVTPLYPFGYGLSYTTFAYSEVTVSAAQMGPADSVTVSATVTNTGLRAGEEVAQCYLQDIVSSATRPVRELKGFARLALAPGEARRVTFRLGPDELGYYGPGGRWVVEPGRFQVWVGGDSRAALAATFEVV
jgi:beta-glucosidase